MQLRLQCSPPPHQYNLHRAAAKSAIYDSVSLSGLDSHFIQIQNELRQFTRRKFYLTSITNGDQRLAYNIYIYNLYLYKITRLKTRISYFIFGSVQQQFIRLLLFYSALILFIFLNSISDYVRFEFYVSPSLRRTTLGISKSNFLSSRWR